LAWIALALSVVLSQVSGFWPIFLCAVPFALAVATIMPLTETVAVHGVKSAGLDYGRMRVWGSLAFIAVGLVAGALVDQSGPSVSLWLLMAGSTATVAAAHALPLPSPPVSLAPPSEPRALLGPDVLRLARLPLFFAFLVAASCTQAAHALFYTFGALHWQSQGISASWVGVLWAIGVMSEVVLFAYAGVIVARISAAALLVAGAFAGVLRWSLMSFDPALEILIPLQLLHAISFGATHLGAIQFISKAVPEAASGTAQALYATFAAGVVMGAATLACGSLYKAYSGDAYLAMALLSAVSLAASLYVTRRWDRGVL
jgi:MFS transporter, PPP family, 3-phenylpropionic acid transporter